MDVCFRFAASRASGAVLGPVVALISLQAAGRADASVPPMFGFPSLAARTARAPVPVVEADAAEGHYPLLTQQLPGDVSPAFHIEFRFIPGLCL